MLLRVVDLELREFARTLGVKISRVRRAALAGGRHQCGRKHEDRMTAEPVRATFVVKVAHKPELVVQGAVAAKSARSAGKRVGIAHSVRIVTIGNIAAARNSNIRRRPANHDRTQGGEQGARCENFFMACLSSKISPGKTFPGSQHGNGCIAKETVWYGW